MADWKNTEQNPLLGMFSNALEQLRNGANTVRFPDRLPLVGGVGAGDLLIGGAPEELEKWSYGNSPMKEQFPGLSAAYPDFKRGRAQGVADVFLLPVTEAALGAKMTAKGLSVAAERAVAGGFDAGRRAALRSIGGGLATAAQVGGAGAGVKLLTEHLAPKLDNVAEHAVPAAAKAAVRATPREFFAMIRGHQKELRRAHEALDAEHAPAMSARYDQDMHDWEHGGEEEWAAREEDANWDPRHDDHEEPPTPGVWDYEDNVYNPAKRKLIDEHRAKLAAARADPKYAGYKTSDEIFHEEHGSEYGSLSKSAQERVHARLKDELGILQDDEVLDLLKKGGDYTDPESGARAVLDKHGQLNWQNPKTGQTAAYKHWLHGDIE